MADTGEDSKDNSGLKTGLSALDVPVLSPENVETFLQFQWMRVHPSTAISLSEDQSSSAVQVARMVPQYRAAVAARKKSEKNKMAANTPDQDDVDLHSPFFQASGIEVDLCDLFDPPLLSENVPGFSWKLKKTSSDDDIKTSSKVARRSESSHIGHRTNDLRTKEDMLGILQIVVDAARNELNGKTSDVGHLLDALRPLHHLSPDSLLDYLSSQAILDKVLEESDMINYDLLIKVLTLCARFGASEALGCHLLNVVAPALLDEPRGYPTNDHSALKCFAEALVINCSLWKLTKRELLASTPANPQSSVMKELVCCVAESYFWAKQQA